MTFNILVDGVHLVDTMNTVLAWMERRPLALGVAMLVTIAAAVACSDEGAADLTVTSPPAEAGATQTTTDGGLSTPSVDASTDAPTTSSRAPIAPATVTKLVNAINPYGLVFGSDGFVYSAGATIESGVRKLAVRRLKDGVVDTTFGVGGVLTADVPGDVAVFEMVEVSSGNFAMVANAGGAVWLIKLTSNAGVFSLSAPTFVKFGYELNEGWPLGTPSAPVTAPSYTAWGLSVDRSSASPKLVVFAQGAPPKAADVANQRIDNDRWITRLDAQTLAIDPTFNSGAPFSADVDGKHLGDNARRGYVHSDGSIISAGYTNFGSGQGNHVVLIKLLPNGTPDPGFGFGTTTPIAGQAKFNPFMSVNGTSEAYAVGRLSDGSFVTTGYGVSNADVTSTNVDLLSFRVKADGLDTTYGKLGSFVIQSEMDHTAGLGKLANSDRGRDLVVLDDDRVVQAGAYDDFSALYVTDKDGKLDPTVGLGGRIDYAFPTNFFKVVRSADGKQIAAVAQSVETPIDGGTSLDTILVTLKVGP